MSKTLETQFVFSGTHGAGKLRTFPATGSPHGIRFWPVDMIKGLGTDIVEIARIRQMIERHGDAFLQRCYTANEIEWAVTYRDSAVRFAGRWAAKEAVVKALGTGFVKGVTFHDVEVLPLHTGQPQVQLSGAAAERATELGIRSMMITISHCREHATATAIGV